MPREWARIAIEEATRQIPGPDGRRFAEMFHRGSLSVELYAPRGSDPQGPHDRDEVYVVHRGHGWFACGAARERFGPGDVLFAAAGAPHRFEDFSEDLTVWVIFYGPAGGER